MHLKKTMDKHSLRKLALCHFLFLSPKSALMFYNRDLVSNETVWCVGGKVKDYLK